MTNSPRFVRKTEGNGAAERLIGTLTEKLLWGRHFAAVAEPAEPLHEYKGRYNERWWIERHGFRTASQAKTDIAAELKY